MEISKAAVGFMVGACLTAGAGGAFLATRGGDPAAAEGPVVAQPAGPVDQSEGIVVEPPAVEATTFAAPSPARPVAPAPRPAPARATGNPTSERRQGVPGEAAPRVSAPASPPVSPA